MASAPRKTFKLPSMCAITKPTSTMPATAITTFLPTMVLHNVTAGLLGHTLRDLLIGSDRCRSATVPSSNCVVMCCLQPCGRRCVGRRQWTFQQDGETH